ncbi:MAG TPA: GNAT family N-acetyltransferase [Mycobacteriales bacterium]|jgi:predicted GNAT family acetyltransferase
MGWVVEKDIDAYADRVLPWLAANPAWNSVAATVLITRRDGTVRGDDPWLAWLPDASGAVAAVALRTPPRGLLLSKFPAAAVRGLADVAPPDLPEAVGPAEQVGEFGTAYAHRTGATARLNRRDRLYELTEPAEPPRPAGRPRLAEDADAELCTRWLADFDADTGFTAQPDVETSRRVIAQRRVWLWDVDGTPVCLVGHTPTVAGVSRIGPVWTPPEHRRHGYAAATTAAVAAGLAARGRVVLFADNANLTSTGVYLRIGFRPVGDWDEWLLEY